MSTPTRIVILIAFYFVSGLLGKAASFLSGEVSLVWPPFGIGLAVVLLLGYKYWPGVALGAALFSMMNGPPFGWATAGSAVGSAVGAILCAYLLERFVKFRPSLERVRDVAGLSGLAGLLGTPINAVFSVVGLCFDKQRAWENLFPLVVDWWLPNAMAVLVVTPVILAWAAGPKLAPSATVIIEAIMCSTGLIAGTMVSFNSWYVYGIQTYPLAYLPFPFLVWGALRFGPRGATTGTLLVSILAIHSLQDRRGPFLMPTTKDSLILLGSYIALLAVTNLLLAAAATEREQAEAAVRRSERRYRGIVQDQTELIWRFREDGTVTFVNDAYCRFHGRDREELLGTKYLPMLSDEDRDIPLSYFACLPPENPVISYDYKLVLPSGDVVWQQCSTRRLFNDKGETLEFQSVAQDVTRRKQIEEEVRQGEARLRAILNTMVDGLMVLDQKGEVTSFNPAAERIFGLSSEQVLGRPLRTLVAPDDQEIFEKYVAQLNGEGKIIELRAGRHDGSMIPIDLAVSKVWLGGTPMTIALVRDISERKRLEEQFRQSQKMEAVGRLAGGIAHDFNNLIQAIIGYSSLLLNRLPPGNLHRDTVEQIEKAAERAAALTGQLLAFSRKQVLKPRIFSLNGVVTDMQKLLQRLIGENIELATDLDPSLGAVRADPGQIEQVILNLCLNARDAMPQGGVLSIQTKNVDLTEKEMGFTDEFQPGKYVALSIIDSGCGMTAETKARLFEPFFTTKEVGKGTGLGLSIVYGIVRQSGGEITVTSKIREGTTFHIYLPYRQPHTADAVAAPPPKAAKSGGELVLLVEDGEIVRALLTEVLQAEGYQVLESCNGEEALQKAADHSGRIDLLITDLVMPKMSGRNLSERLLLTRPGLRVLYISGYTDDEVVRHGQLENAADFLQKPFRPDALLAKVRQMLDTPRPQTKAASFKEQA